MDPQPTATPEICAVYDKYPHFKRVLPAVGYSPEQLAQLETTINAVAADVVVSGSPIDLARLLRLEIPIIEARSEVAEAGEPTLMSLIDTFLATPPR